MNKITKRDVTFFLLGILTLFIIETIWNWEENVNAFNRGFNSAFHSTR